MARINSRTTNTIYNFISSIGGQLITIIMQFVVRTVFISTLGKSYLGISGLFSNILSMLSLAEFGVGSAILFKLYEPIASQNFRRISILMAFYKRVYLLIGVVVTLIGVCLVPFLPSLIQDYDTLAELNINAVLIFFMYLANTAFSYLFFAYKSAIVRAHQKEYIINLVTYLVTVGTGILQILVLVLLHNFEAYVAVYLVTTVLQNLVYATIANKMFPYIKEKPEKKIEVQEVKEIIKDCYALFLYRINGVVLKASDNIIISTFMGLQMVGMYSNYYVFYTTINSLFGNIFGAAAHSIGNLHASKNTKHEYAVFESTILITAILGGTAGVGIACVADSFVKAWIGSDWVLAQPFSILMGLELFTLAFRQSLSKFRTSMGLFQQAKYRPLFGMIIKLILSVLLVRKWGICGVLLGTIIADWATIMWFDPIIIHKHGFHGAYPVRRYFGKLLTYFVTVLAVAALDLLICSNFLAGYGWLTVVIHGIICGCSVPLALFLITSRKPEGKYIRKLAGAYVTKIVKKIKGK